MNVCALCGMQLVAEAALCWHHVDAVTERWAAGNRIMCDLVHRGILPPRSSAAQRAAESLPDGRGGVIEPPASVIAVRALQGRV